MKESEEVEDTNGITLIDPRNGFSKISFPIMLCTVRHLWTSGARFALNFYFHEALLFV